MASVLINVAPAKNRNNAVAHFVYVDEVPPHLTGIVNTGIELREASHQRPFVGLKAIPPANDIVRQCGNKLFARLSEHERFRKLALDPATRTPIYFKLESPATENLPWEALWDPTQMQFIALHEQWPIARVAPSSQTMHPTSTIEPELKLLIVLAAARGAGVNSVDASGEWKRIWEAVTRSPYADRVRLHVLHCQSAVKQAIEQLNDPRVTSEPLLSIATLRTAVSAMAPNIVHFFCHGGVDGTVPRLELATPANYDADEPGELRPTPAMLLDLGFSESIWLVTLNCCQGACGSASVRSFAADLAASGGLPAVVAMRENVDVQKANTFAGEFYHNLIDRLGAFLPGKEEAEQEWRSGTERRIPEEVWVDAMYPPRSALAQPQPEGEPAWTLPVVYVQRGDLRLRARPRTSNLIALLDKPAQDKIVECRVRAERIQQALSHLPPSTPPAALQELGKAASAAIEEADRSELAALRHVAAAANLSPLIVADARQRIGELEARLG